MKIPSTVKIGAQEFEIVWMDSPDEAEKQLGLTKAHLNRMEIAKNADGERIPEGSIVDHLRPGSEGKTSCGAGWRVASGD